MWFRIQLTYHKWDTKRRIRRRGWTGIYVGNYERSPTWAYTIGFHGSLGAPEVVVFDLPQSSVNSLFYEIYRQLKAGELVLRDGDHWRPEGVEKPLAWRRVHPSRLYDNDREEPWLGLAEDFARILWPEKEAITAFQLVLSDHDGRFPWDEGYDESLRHLQSPLWEPVELAAEPPV